MLSRLLMTYAAHEPAVMLFMPPIVSCVAVPGWTVIAKVACVRPAADACNVVA